MAKDIKKMISEYKKVSYKIETDTRALQKAKKYLEYLIVSDNKNEIEETKKKIKALTKSLERNHSIFNDKKQYFNVSMKELLNGMKQVLQNAYPYEKIDLVAETKTLKKFVIEDFYGDSTYYNKELVFGCEIKSLGIRKTFEINENYSKNSFDALDYFFHENINLVDRELIFANNAFSEKEFKDLFFEIFEKNINDAVEKLKNKHENDKKSLEERYNDEMEEIFR